MIPSHTSPVLLAEFFGHVERRADLDHETRETKTAAVLTALDDTVSGGELDRAREQLPEDYDRLFEADK